MASYYISGAGSDVTGDGSSGNPWATISHARTNSLAGDIIYLTGSSVFGCGTDLSSRVYAQNPAESARTSTLQMDQSSTVNTYGTTFLNLDIDITNNAGYFRIASNYSGMAVYNCKISNQSGVARSPQCFDVQLFSRSRNLLFQNCDFDCTDINGDILADGNTNGGGNFIGCSFYNITWSNKYICNANNSSFAYCKFYDINATGGIVNNASSTTTGNQCSFYHNTFLIENNGFSIINNATNGGTCSFNSNIVNGDTITYSSVFSSLTENMSGLVGNNCFYEVTTGASYDNIRSLTDYTDLSSSFKSTNPLDSDFLQIKDTSNGKNGDSFNNNLDCGAVQGTALTDYPAEADVLSGVDYNFGNNTGTLVIPTPPNNYDLREGVVVGAVTGILKVPTASQVEEGVEFDRTDTPITGTLTPLSPQLGPFTVTVYTSDGSNISGTTAQPTITVEVDSGVQVNTILSDLGASETYESGTTLVRNASNARRLDIRIDR